MKIIKHSFDGVIVGAGGAGLRAAIEAAPHMKLAVITKLYPTRSHTGAAQGGMSAALANVEEDNWNWHAFDTVKGSDYLADQPAVDILCKEAIDAVIELEHWGLPFSRLDNGKIAQRRFGGHTIKEGEAPAFRACYAADRTGHMILQTLYQKCVSMGVEFFDEFQVLDIKIEDGMCKGVIAFELATGDIHIFETRAVTFATGGFGKIFKVSSNAHSLTGDGPGMLYQKGIPLEDMEFYQFHPTGIYRLGILLSEAARGEGGILRNKDGERFMERYAPTIKDLAPRDMVSRAIATEISEGNGAGPQNDYVFLDLTHLGEETIRQKLPDITDFVRTYVKIEPINDPIPVQPTAHYAMGGIPTDVFGRVVSDEKNTVLPGVYAAGEAACVSVHGANRLGTNSLLDIVVFGKRAGQSMLDYVSNTKASSLSDNASEELVNKLNKLLEKEHTDEFSVGRIRNDLQESMEENAKIFRTEETLNNQVEILENLRERYENVSIFDKGRVFNTDLMEAIDEDGWLYTGDVGEMNGRFIKIIDRKKDIIITAGGKNISPSEIENTLKISPFIKDAIVIGDKRKFLSALIAIEFDTVSNWALRKGITHTTYRDLSEKPEVKDLISKEVIRTNEHTSLQIRKFEMIPKELDHEEGELTATQKIKRNVLEEQFSDLIESMYK